MNKLLFLCLISTLLSGCYKDLKSNADKLMPDVIAKCNGNGGVPTEGVVIGSNGITTEVGLIMLCLPKGG